MALIVEDGTGLNNSNSYLSNADFLAYCLSRNIDVSAYTETAIDAALLTCTVDYIDVYYCFRGEKLNDEQALSLPTDLVGINKDIQNATANGAYLHLQGLLLIDESAINQGGDIKSQQDKLDVLETKTEYIEGTASKSKRDTPIMDRLLNKYSAFGAGPRLVIA